MSYTRVLDCPLLIRGSHTQLGSLTKTIIIRPNLKSKWHPTNARRIYSTSDTSARRSLVISWTFYHSNASTVRSRFAGNTSSRPHTSVQPTTRANSIALHHLVRLLHLPWLQRITDTLPTPTGPLCNEPIAIPPGQNPNHRMEHHFVTDCTIMTGRPANRKNKATPTCARAKCGKVLFAPISCEVCDSARVVFLAIY